MEDAPASTVPQFIAAGCRSSKLWLLNSPVWADFQYNAGVGGVAATATCRWCDKTMCAGGRNGTSHLHRHINKSCPARVEERRRQTTTTAPAAAEPAPSTGEQQELEEEEQSFYFVDGLNIPRLFDELDAKGLVHIDQVTRQPNLPQASNSSSRWFFQKTRERKRTESKKRCIPDGCITQNQLFAQGDLNFKGKKMLANSAIHDEARTASGDYSCGATCHIRTEFL